MRKVTLHFRTVADMVNFELKVDTHTCLKKRSHLTITGYFDKAQIELARSGFNASVEEIE